MVVALARVRLLPSGASNRKFGTMFAEVEVNTLTGEVRVLRMLATQDSGKVMNLFTYENQVQGGMVWGVSMELTEGRVMDEESGKMLNANFHDYKIPTAKDAPGEMTVIPIETPYTATIHRRQGTRGNVRHQPRTGNRQRLLQCNRRTVFYDAPVAAASSCSSGEP